MNLVPSLYEPSACFLCENKVPVLSCLPLPQLLSSDRKMQGQDVAAGESKNWERRGDLKGYLQSSTDEFKLPYDFQKHD